MPANRFRFPALPELLLGAVLLLGAGSASHAATESFSISFPGPDDTTYQITNWTTSLTVSKFDPSLGVLQSIDFSLTGRVQGTVKFESQDGSPTTVTTDLAANVILKRPNNTSLVISSPLVETTTNVTAYDGVLDYGGTSGRTFSGLQNSDTEGVTGDASASDLALFTGASGAPGTISLPAVGQGASNASGAGNLTTQFQTFAGADVTITYNYLPIPEPGTCALVFGGLGALVGVQRFRRR